MKKELKEEDSKWINYFSDRRDWVSQMLPAEFQYLDLDAIAPRCEQQANVLSVVCAYRDDVRSGGCHPLVLYGEPGSGKTMLTAALWNNLASCTADRHSLKDTRNAGTADNVLWVNGSELPGQYWKAAEHADRRTSEERIHHICTAGFVVLDDLDKHPAGGWSEKVYGLIDARCCRRQVPTVITMNLTPAGFAKKYGDEFGLPAVDRLARMGGVFIRLDKEGM